MPALSPQQKRIRKISVSIANTNQAIPQKADAKIKIEFKITVVDFLTIIN